MKTSAYLSMINTVNEISIKGKNIGIVRQYVNEIKNNGRVININNKDYLHFGSCGYLGLELDKRLMNAAKNAIDKFGIQFVSSRTYVACGLYKELEEKLKIIFGGDVIVYPKVSQGHINVMPIIFGPNDYVIFDQQAHVSMQEAIYKLKYYGTEVTILRHNNMDDLENKIIENRNKYSKIWYVFDGVYSMFGDSPNYKKINELVSKYRQLYLYIDDAHGTSWTGENGKGFALKHISKNKKMVLVASLVKAFGASGGAFVFYDQEMYEKVVAWGGSYTYAGPIEPATLGAAIASCNIHLSDEIYLLQNKLKERIEYCYKLLIENELPLISIALSPIFYIGVGTASMGFNMVKKLMDDGYYTNLGIYPAVPESCTGVRFTLTNHLQFEDIENFVKTLKKHFPEALREENRNIKDIVRAFKKFTNLEYLLNKQDNNQSLSKNEDLRVEIYNSIDFISIEQWNSMFKTKGAFQNYFLKTIENSFIDNIEKENNWKFYYIIIKEKEDVILATHFTVALTKDDMLSSQNVSEKIELLRKEDKYFLTSQTLIMGSLLSNGEHLFINKSNKNWEKAVKLLMDEVWKIYDKNNIKTVLLREFDPDDLLLINKFDDFGYAKLEMPENNQIISSFNNAEEYFNRLNKKQRYQIRKEILPDIDNFIINTQKCNNEELQYCYNLYLQTKKNKLSVNTFDLPFTFFKNVNESKNWEIIRIFHKSNLTNCISMGICFKHNDEYSTVVYGMDTKTSLQNIYKKSLYLVIKHALNNNFKIIHLGITANETKHIFGAIKKKQIGYALIKDSYNFQLLQSIEGKQ